MSFAAEASLKGDNESGFTVLSIAFADRRLHPILLMVGLVRPAVSANSR